MVRTTVFGAGAMGTAIAMHLARQGNPTALWASEYDLPVLPALREDRRHPALPEHLPDSLRVLDPEQLAEAVAGIELAVMGAHSGGARSLARAVGRSHPLPVVVGLAKGLEPGTRKRVSEIYAEEAGHRRVVSMGGPCLAAEVAQGLPTAVVFATDDRAAAGTAVEAFESRMFFADVTDDVVGVEYCMVAKNVAAIAIGILDGMGKGIGFGYRNAKAGVFAEAFAELVALVTAYGGRADTVSGLAGLGDALVTALGGRNRLYGELLGEGAEPEVALGELQRRGMTVEGVDSARDVGELARERDLDLPLFEQMHRIVVDRAPPQSVLDCLGTDAMRGSGR